MRMWCEMYYLTALQHLHHSLKSTYGPCSSSSCRLKMVHMAPSVRESVKLQLKRERSMGSLEVSCDVKAIRRCLYSKKPLEDFCRRARKQTKIDNLVFLPTWWNLSAQIVHSQAYGWCWGLCASVPAGHSELWPAAQLCVLGVSQRRHTDKH